MCTVIESRGRLVFVGSARILRGSWQAPCLSFFTQCVCAATEPIYDLRRAVEAALGIVLNAITHRKRHTSQILRSLHGRDVGVIVPHKNWAFPAKFRALHELLKCDSFIALSWDKLQYFLAFTQTMLRQGLQQLIGQLAHLGFGLRCLTPVQRQATAFSFYQRRRPSL